MSTRHMLLFLAVIFLPFFAEASDITMRIMPSPQTPEADFAAQGTGGWDAGVGYGRLRLKDTASGSLNGAVAGGLYSFGMNRDENAFGNYSLDAHFFGFYCRNIEIRPEGPFFQGCKGLLINFIAVIFGILHNLEIKG